MPAYAIALVKVNNPEMYKEYAKLAAPAVAQHGGRTLAIGGIAEVNEGGVPFDRVAVTEFSSVEAARACYTSPEYLLAQSKRIGAADFNMIFVEGK